MIATLTFQWQILATNALAINLFFGNPTISSDIDPGSEHEGKTVRQWHELLKSKDKTKRSGAARALGKIGPSAAIAVPDLKKALADEDVLVRVEAAFALWQINRSKESIPVLIKSLQHQGKPPPATGDFKLDKSLADIQKQHDRVVRGFASMYLAMIGRPAIDELKIALRAKNLNPNVEGEAIALALGMSYVINKLDASELTKLLNDPNNNVRIGSVLALKAMGERAVPALVKSLSHKDDFVRRSAVYLLGEIGPKAKAAIPALKKTADKDSYAIRVEAVKALRKINKK